MEIRPIRGLEFAQLADLPALSFGAQFAQLAADGFPRRGRLHKT
jgi:hypothetical protein